MENVNAEQIKMALVCCTFGNMCGSDCPYDDGDDDIAGCTGRLTEDALALINSQEQRIKELTEENEGLRVDKKKLINENAELKSQIQEADISEEDIDLYDEFTKLLTEGIRDAKADTVRKMQERLKAETITIQDHTGKLGSVILVSTIDQIAKEMLEGENDNT